MADLSAEKAALLLLAIAVAGWYAAASAAADVLTGRTISPGRRAVGYWIPTVATALGAVLVGRPLIAVGVIFGTSVACLTLVLGIVTLMAPADRLPQSRRLWAFVLPAALIALMVGFSGGVRWIHALILSVEGAAVWLLWNDPQGSADASPPAPWVRRRWMLLGAAIIAAVVATWAGITAAGDLSSHLNLPSPGLVAALMLSPALVLPLIGAGSADAHEGRYDHAVTTQVGFVLLNLCALLPVAAILWLTRSFISPAASDNGIGLVYPMAVWRVDTLFLVAAGMLLFPVAAGRWTLGRAEGLGLVIAYMVYMILTAAMAR